MDLLGIDIGGSGIKGALVSTETGELVSDRRRIAAPDSFQPEAVIDTLCRLIGQFDYQGPLGVGFPAVVSEGTVMTAATSHSIAEWIGVPVAQRISQATGCAAVVLNDADAAGLAEMKFGAGRNRRGVVMIFTLGTGIGSALFVNGRLVPNLELGRIYMRRQKKVVEYQAAERVRDEQGLSWKAWGQRLNDYFNHIERVFSPDLIIVGGGVSKKHERFLPYIKVRAELVPATLRNQAGIVGAAMAGVEEFG